MQYCHKLYFLILITLLFFSALYLILNQVEEAVKLKPDLIIIGHTSEYRWKVWDFRKNMWQGFIVANHVVKNEKYYTF